MKAGGRMTGTGGVANNLSAMTTKDVVNEIDKIYANDHPYDVQMMNKYYYTFIWETESAFPGKTEKVRAVPGVINVNVEGEGDLTWINVYLDKNLEFKR